MTARCLLTFLTLTATLQAGPALWYRHPAASWSEALPIGNGRLAAMVFGGVENEHLQLNEETIYAGKRMDRVNPAARAAIPEIRKLLLDGKPQEAEELAAKNVLAIPLRQPPYQPLGDIQLAFKNETGAEPRNYKRSLDLENGLASVDYDLAGVHFRREVFASYPDKAIVLRLTSNGASQLSFTVSLTRSATSNTTIDSAFGPNSIVLRGQAVPPTTGRGYPGEPATGVKFTSAVRVLSNGHISAADNATVQVSDASEATLVFTAATDIRSAQPDKECRDQLRAAAASDYSDLLARHRADFSRLATRVHLQLGDSDDVLVRTPTDELLKNTTGDADDRALTALYFAYGRYLLQSSSRENSLAANLQGKWNESFDPSWGSKYTININTEMNYWPAEVCNLPETVDGLYNLMQIMKPNGEKTAAEMYGTGGWVAHHNTEVWGDAQPIDGVGSGVWPFGAAWLSLTLWDHYDYSRDSVYLREKAYPIMRETARFLLENLFDDGARHLVSGPSLSPENKYLTPNGQPVSLDVSPTMDVELTRALFDRICSASARLEVDKDFCERLKSAEAKLIPLQVGRYGQLQEWRKDYEEREVGHRHLSHLFAVYPSNEINEKTPELWQAARKSLERRLDHGGGGTGWSRAWVVCLWATFHEGDKADESLRVLFEKSTWPNLFDLHPPHIFQIDGNLGATAGIAEMLMQSYGNRVQLLPALPANWPSGSVTGLRARGGATIDFFWQNGQVREATLHSALGGSWELGQANGTSQRVELRRGEKRTVQFH